MEKEDIRAIALSMALEFYAGDFERTPQLVVDAAKLFETFLAGPQPPVKAGEVVPLKAVK